MTLRCFEVPLHRSATRLAMLAWLILTLLAVSGIAALAGQGPPGPYDRRWTQPQAPAPAVVVPSGQWFQINYDFWGHIVRADLTSHVGAGEYAVQARMNEMFLVLRIEVQNRGYGTLTPPVHEIKSLSTQDGRYPIPADMQLASRFNDPRFGGSARIPLGPGGTSTMLAIYHLPNGVNPDSLYYTVHWEPLAQQLVLAQLPR